MLRMMVGKSPPSNFVFPGPSGEQGVAAEEDRVAFEPEAHGARRVAGGEDGVQPQPADLEHVVVDQHVVVARQHRRVLGRDGHRVAGVAQLGHGLDVVPVAVGLEHPAHAEHPAEVEQALVLVGGVEQHRVAGLGAPEHEHVVLEVSDDHLVDLGARGAPDEGVSGHDGQAIPTIRWPDPDVRSSAIESWESAPQRPELT